MRKKRAGHPWKKETSKAENHAFALFTQALSEEREPWLMDFLYSSLTHKTVGSEPAKPRTFLTTLVLSNKRKDVPTTPNSGTHLYCMSNLLSQDLSFPRNFSSLLNNSQHNPNHWTIPVFFFLIFFFFLECCVKEPCCGAWLNKRGTYRSREARLWQRRWLWQGPFRVTS